MSKIPHKRFTVSIAPGLAQTVNEYVSGTHKTSRSEVVEQALRLWLSLAQHPNKDPIIREVLSPDEEQKERELYRSYYANLSEAARAEDAAWHAQSVDSNMPEWNQ